MSPQNLAGSPSVCVPSKHVYQCITAEVPSCLESKVHKWPDSLNVHMTKVEIA